MLSIYQKFEKGYKRLTERMFGSPHPDTALETLHERIRTNWNGVPLLDFHRAERAARKQYTLYPKLQIIDEAIDYRVEHEEYGCVLGIERITHWKPSKTPLEVYGTEAMGDIERGYSVGYSNEIIWANGTRIKIDSAGANERLVQDIFGSFTEGLSGVIFFILQNGTRFELQNVKLSHYNRNFDQTPFTDYSLGPSGDERRKKHLKTRKLEELSNSERILLKIT